jgi:Zn-dependent oligopeptidase
MKRFYFLSCIAAALLLTDSCNSGSNSAGSSRFNSIETGFLNPDSMQLGVYWYWISDNISKEGVVKDLEAMKRVGINRAFIGNIGLDEDVLPIKKHKLFSPEWWDITHTALKTAGELGIEIGMFNSPGWSQSGGPWVKPEESMRYLASSNITLKGPRANAIIALPLVAKDAMEDVKVIAYPLSRNINYLISRKISKKKEEILTLDVPVGEMPIRSFIFKTAAPIKSNAEIHVKENGQYRLLKKFEIDRSNPELHVGFDPYAPVVISLPETKATDLRFVMTTKNSEGAAEVTFSTAPQVERYPEKTLAKMFQTPLPLWHDYMWDKQPELPADLCVDPAKVIDLTDKVKDGVLTWDIPEGDWTVVRTAMRTTKVTNAPASKEGSGLEIDKINKDHISAHFDAFIGEILRRIPADDRKSFKVIVEDSYETGGLNWTDGMIEKFESAYGYSPVPYLPVLQGVVVGSQDQSDRFLWDLRRLIADRVAYDYVGGLREISNSNGLTTWLENYGHWGFPSEFLMYGGQSDEIGGEFWSEGSLGDIENHAAASCAHTYGKRKVWAESCTSGGPVFSRYPNIMKQRIDRFFTEGINSTLLHVYIHQPAEELTPGVDAWFGNEFNRKNTWFDQMDVFAKYLKRCNLMLQQGLFVADVAYFIGEDAPKMTGVRTPELPRGYAFDYMNAEVLLTRATIKNGRLTLPDGMSYSVLVLPQLETMRPAVLAKIKELVNEGLVILGPSPKRSPSLQNYPEADREIETMAAELWGDGTEKIRTVGKGRVFADGQSLEDVFSALNIAPDVVPDNDEILFIHRALPEGDIYFVSNQSDKPVDINPLFRVSGRIPELWNPLTDEIRDLKQFSVTKKTTGVPLRLEAFESSFIVFRKAGKPTKNAVNFPGKEIITTIGNPWKVTFDNAICGINETVTMNSLEDWSKSTDKRIRYYSGTAVYRNSFRIDKVADKQLYIDLGKVMVMAKVKINGEYAGGVWTSPYCLNITKLVKEGENSLEIEVVNNWMNRLIGDLNLPEKERKTWVKINPWKSDSPLQSSGLLGPVTVYLRKNKTDMNETNPFFADYSTPFGVPPFDKIKFEDYKPAMLKGMEDHQKEIDAITANTATPDFENTIVALDQSGRLLRDVRTVFSGQNSANTNDEMQELNKELSPLMSKHSDDIMLNAKLFEKIKYVYEHQPANLNKEQAKLVEETYKDFVRSGANLSAEKQARLRELNSQISLLQLTFSQNMLKETNAFKLVIDRKEDLAGLPQSLISVAAEEAKAAGQEGKWIFTLHNPSVMPFLQFADNRALREKIFNGYLMRGNNNNDADNKDVVRKLVTLRLEKGKLMGFDDYAGMALEERMAKNEQNVYDLLDQVWAPALAKAKQEAADLTAMMHKEGVAGELKGWDWRYYNEKVMKEKFDIDENETRPYFKLENVMQGLFYVVNRLYHLTFTEIKDIPKPHPDAYAFECKNEDGSHRGIVYMDFFPRPSKRGGAWCGTYRSQSYDKNGKRVAPIVTIVCNFTKPSEGQPALLSLDEAETMFHEFGHGLHNLFKDVHYYGTSGVPRDFVELPSQVMEHWVLEPEVLKVYAKHYQTGEVIPEALVGKIVAGSKYGQGFATAEYLQASYLDMDYHVLKAIPEDFDIVKFEANSMNRRAALSQIPPRYRTTYFNHTMGGGYTAGYYSYMWAEVLDADAFEAYKETGDIFDRTTAAKFRDYILTPGGIDDAMQMYKNFRGKEPSIDPLLKNRGLK